MSTQSYESLYNQLLEASIHMQIEDLGMFLEKDFIKNEAKMNWILEKAIVYKDTKLINFLILSGMKIDIMNAANQTALHVAAYEDFFEIVDSLFDHCNNEINYTDVNGLTHFHIACITGNVKMAEHFLLNGVDVNIRYQSNALYTEDSFTPLLFAVKYEQMQIVELLLKYGADPNYADYFNVTPLHLACNKFAKRTKFKKQQEFSFNEELNLFNTFVDQSDDLKITKLLISHGSNLNAMDNSGNTPLFVIFQNEHLQYINKIFHSLPFDVDIIYKIIQKFRKKQKEHVKILLENGADVRKLNNAGDNILHAVIRDMTLSRHPEILPNIYFDDRISVEIIELFLNSGANVDIKNKKDETPLQIAVSLLSSDAVKILLDYNSNINNIKFNSGNNHSFYYSMNILPPLEATENLIKIINLVLKKGFRLNQKDNLAIFKFFVCNNENCQYGNSDDIYALYKLKNLLELGAVTNIKNVLNKFSKNTYTCTYADQAMIKQMITQVHRYLSILEIGSLYISEEVKQSLKLTILSLEKHLLRFLSVDEYMNQRDVIKIKNEIQEMKAIKINNCLTMHDILTMNPHSIYFHIKNCDYKSIFKSNEFKKSFSYCANIIKGHFTKGLIRHYIFESANEYLRYITISSLPDLCCEKIFSYLNNENLLHLCLAITGTANDQKSSI